MVLPYVCNECRRSLLRHTTALGRAQWATRAYFTSFTSFTDSVAEILPQRQNDPSQRRRESKGRIPERPLQSDALDIRLNELFAYKRQPSQPGGRGRYSQHSEEPLEEKLGNAASLKDVSHLQANLEPDGQGPSQSEKIDSLAKVRSRAGVSIEDTVSRILNAPSHDPSNVTKSQWVQPVSTQPVQRSQAEPVAAKLDAILLDESKDALDAYKFFARKYRHRNILALQKPALQDRSLLLKGAVFSRLLRNVTVAWCHAQELDESSLPSPSQLLSRLASLRVHRPEHVLDSLWILMHNLYKQNIIDSQDDPSPLEYEILKLWAHLFKYFGLSSRNASIHSTSDRSSQVLDISKDREAEDEFELVSGLMRWPVKSAEAFTVDWSSLPKTSTLVFILSNGARAKSVSSRLRSCISIPSEHIASLGAAALATFDHFSHRVASHSLDDITEDVEPFVKFMAHVVYRSDVFLSVKAFEEQAMQAGVDEAVVREASNRMRDYPLQEELFVASSLGVKGARALSRESLEAYFTSRLGKALEKSNLQEVLRLWDHATRAYKNISDHEKGAALSLADSEEDANAGALPSKLYSSFLHTLTGLGRHGSAVEVWNYMIQHGTKPTTHQYNAMMQGAVRQRDAEAPERIWRMMINSGVDIDVSCWNTRVHAMALSGRSVNAIGLLEEMSDLWKRSQLSQGKEASFERPAKAHSVPAAVQPSVETFNACVTVFARKGRRDLIQRAFAWANREGIKPDHITFNALISLALRAHNVPDAMKLFGQMLQQGVAPDDATFAIILNALFRSVTIQAMTPQEQKNLVKGMLEGISELGLGTGSTANHVYAMFVDRLLKDHGNMEGAQMVISFMREKGVVITPHIYTSLMTHYFQGSDEPDFMAIENLWAKMRSEGAAMDHLFFDRMVEMYARVGEMGHALMFLGRMSNQGCKPSKSALMELLEALMRQGQWDRVRELVTDIKEEKGLVKGGIKVNVRPGFERKFWRFIEDVENEMEFMYGKSESQANSAAMKSSSVAGISVE